MMLHTSIARARGQNSPEHIVQRDNDDQIASLSCRAIRTRANTNKQLQPPAFNPLLPPDSSKTTDNSNNNEWKHRRRRCTRLHTQPTITLANREQKQEEEEGATSFIVTFLMVC